MTCSACGRQIEKVPAWLSEVTVDFICTNCPKRGGRANETLAPAPREPKAAELTAKPEGEPEEEADLPEDEL